MAAAREEVIEYAVSYPYDVWDGSFILVGEKILALELQPGEPLLGASVLTDGGALPIESFFHSVGSGLDVPLADREPILAYGSNPAPATLLRKFGASGTVVPVLRAKLDHFDVVFSSHFGPFGSIPATLQASAGTTTEIFITYLTTEQATKMDATEPNYHFVELGDVSVTFENDWKLDRCYSYITRHGILAVDGQEYALADVRASNRAFPAKTEREILEIVRERYWPDEDFDGFVYGSATQRDTARHRTDILKQTSLPFRWTRWEIVDR
jgi:hypothetical protein